ncbi:MAG: GIY-YIG nuclease family protein [Chlorobi bacterium]|nr:GIY-YIG nuclease family protein [Chlorobiota bacterium]
MRSYYVYILASKKYGTLYVGMTNDLIRRIYQHKHDIIEGFTAKYKTHLLVYFEQGNDVRAIIEREKQLKKWNRLWKLELIEKTNPEWRDLYPELAGLQSSDIK